MTIDEAKTMLQAKLTCMEFKNKVSYEEKCNENCDDCEWCYAQGTIGEHKKALKTAIKALEEIQQYRATGTLEEFKNLKEKNEPKKVEYDEYGEEEGYPYCECGKCLEVHFVRAKYCPSCGQKLDWQ